MLDDNTRLSALKKIVELLETNNIENNEKKVIDKFLKNYSNTKNKYEIITVSVCGNSFTFVY